MVDGWCTKCQRYKDKGCDRCCYDNERFTLPEQPEDFEGGDEDACGSVHKK